jgi:electron transfer flavoprotein beta subunit
LNEPRYAALPSIMRARKKPIEQLRLDELGITIQPRVQVLALEETTTARNGRLVGSIDELIESLREANTI